jgi:hypothetical protein
LDENGKPIDDVQISDENNNETTDNKSKRRRKENINSELEETNQTLNPFDVLPSIKESENEQEVNLEQERITPDGTSFRNSRISSFGSSFFYAFIYTMFLCQHMHHVKKLVRIV